MEGHFPFGECPSLKVEVLLTSHHQLHAVPMFWNSRVVKLDLPNHEVLKSGPGTDTFSLRFPVRRGLHLFFGGRDHVFIQKGGARPCFLNIVS